jgi:hypothetical protein
MPTKWSIKRVSSNQVNLIVNTNNKEDVILKHYADICVQHVMFEVAEFFKEGDIIQTPYDNEFVGNTYCKMGPSFNVFKVNLFSPRLTQGTMVDN